MFPFIGKRTIRGLYRVEIYVRSRSLFEDVLRNFVFLLYNGLGPVGRHGVVFYLWEFIFVLTKADTNGLLFSIHSALSSLNTIVWLHGCLIVSIGIALLGQQIAFRLRETYLRFSFDVLVVKFQITISNAALGHPKTLVFFVLDGCSRD